MISVDEVRHYTALKQRLQEHCRQYGDQLHPHRREYSEGLARFIAIDGEEWSYTALESGWHFHSADGCARVMVATERDADAFTPRELCEYLSCRPEHQNITSVVVDTWLTHEVMRGRIASHPQLPGHFVVADY